MREQYNFDSYSCNGSNVNQRNTNAVPFVDINFDTNMTPATGMMTTNMNMTSMDNMNMMDMSMNQPMGQNIRLANPEQGYTQGNLFDNLYEQYKNYRPMRLIPNNEQAEMLLTANQYTFAAHELRLYLDIYPKNPNLINLFNQYRSMANQAVMDYEQKYGPLNWSALSQANEFSWVTTAWPWEMGEK